MGASTSHNPMGLHCLFFREIISVYSENNMKYTVYTKCRQSFNVKASGMYSMSTSAFLWRYSPNSFLGLPPWNLPFHFGLLSLRHSVGLLGKVISSSQGHRLTHGVEPFLRSCQLCSYSRTSQHFMEPEGSLPCSQEPSTGPYSEPDQFNPYHHILSL
jgi:hypothetical protein